MRSWSTDCVIIARSVSRTSGSTGGDDDEQTKPASLAGRRFLPASSTFWGIVLTSSLRRGDVVRHAEHVLIVWEIDTAGVPRGIPIRPQTGPRHRSHVPVPPMESAMLGLKQRASVILTNDPLVCMDYIPQVIGHCHPSLLEDITRTIARARQAAAFEQAMTQCR